MGFALTSAACAAGHQLTRDGGRELHTVRIAYNNVHALVVDGQALLVDAGMAEDAPELLRRLDAEGVSADTIRGVVITHGHADHAGGGRALRARTQAPVFAGAGDEPLLAEGKNDHLCPTDDRARDDLETHQTARYPGYAADTWIRTQHDLREATGIDAQIVPLPGHTAGSVVLIFGHWAFVGDLFRGAIFGSSAETHFYMCNLADNLADIEWLLATYPDVRTYFTGHFGPVDRDEVVELVATRKAKP